MKNPYIGITGFISSEEISTIVTLLPIDPRRMLMAGILASSDTLRGFPGKRPHRYPKVEDISSIFTVDNSVMNLIHYDTTEEETLLEQLRALTELGGVNLDGFQLNMAWPSPAVLVQWLSEFLGMKVVLQINNSAFEAIKHSPQRLADKVMQYVGIADYILLDPSAGQGKLLDVTEAWAYLSVLKESNVDIGFGVAGGLSKDTVSLLQPLFSEFPDLSIDAEGRLRNESDQLDLKLASAYLQETLAVLSIS